MRIRGSKNRITEVKIKNEIWELLNQAHNSGFDTIKIIEEILQGEKTIKSLSSSKLNKQQ